jgi:hypothetical protein
MLQQGRVRDRTRRRIVAREAVAPAIATSSLQDSPIPKYESIFGYAGYDFRHADPSIRQKKRNPCFYCLRATRQRYELPLNDIRKDHAQRVAISASIAYYTKSIGVT